jgi:hypothetical protein
MEQEPTETAVTVVPDTVQTAGVVEVSATASPELAVELIVNGAVPSATLFSGLNDIVWGVRPVTWKLRVTGVAAA